MLTWQNNLPRFVAKGAAGDRIILFFGHTNIDDIEISEYHFVIQLTELHGIWSVETQLHQYCDWVREFRVDAFLSKLNLALRRFEDFDFSKYLKHWKDKDAHFSAVIINTRKHPREYQSIF